MRYLYTLIFFLVGMHAFAVDMDGPGFKVTIKNDNLFICLENPVALDVDMIELRLSGGRRISMVPVVNDSCETLMYLDAKQAKLVKKKGIKAIAFRTSNGWKKIHVYAQQNEELVSHLP